ncbi:MAG: hypothetical protein ACRDJ3_04625 [Solirubrobacteraceae bacterium]
MDSPTQTKNAPESRRTVDPLAMALFSVVRDLPASERRVLLSVIDGRLHSVIGERSRLALEVLRRCESETQETVSKRRYERWRESHPERASLPSSTYVSNSLGGSWARAMDAAGVTPSVEHSTFRWHRHGPAPSDEEVLVELRRCAQELRVDFTFGEYRAWALEQRAEDPSRRGLLISPSTFITRFESFSQARLAAGLPEPRRYRGPRGNHREYTHEACITVLQAVARLAQTKPLTVSAYTRWRDSQLADARRQGVWRPVPEWKIIRDRFESWPRALVAAGLISAETAAQYHRGQGQRVPDEHIAKWLCAAAAELGPNMTGFAYRRWRQRQIDSQTAGYPPSQRVLQLRFGKWSTAVRSADTSLTAPRPFEFILKILNARKSAL